MNNEIRFYKKLSDLPQDYPVRLAQYLREHAAEFFSNADNKATDQRDFDTWPTYPVDREHLVTWGELLLVDLEYPTKRKANDHCYVICEVTRRRHKLVSGRVVHLKPLAGVIPIDELRGKDWRNGYFLLPKI